MRVCRLVIVVAHRYAIVYMHCNKCVCLCWLTGRHAHSGVVIDLGLAPHIHTHTHNLNFTHCLVMHKKPNDQMILTSAATHDFSTATRKMQYDISTREKIHFLIIRVTREKVEESVGR